jgi:hypothetical protein
MKVVYEYSHLGGAEIMQVRHAEWNAEIYEVIAGVKAHRTKISQEKTKKEKPSLRQSTERAIPRAVCRSGLSRTA